MGLGAFQGRHESVRNGRVGGRGGLGGGGRRKALEGDAEAKLEGSTLERVGRVRVRADAGLAEEP